MRRMAVGMAMVTAMGLAACSSGSGSAASPATSASASASGSPTTTAGPGSSGSSGATAPGAATAARAERRLTAPDGTELVVKPPRPESSYAAKVVYADPSAPASTFTASGQVHGVPLSDLGDWSTRPDGGPGSTPSATNDGAVVATPAAMTQTTGTSVPPSAPTDLCESNPGADCILFSTGWVRLGPDAGTTSSISCPADHPYIEGTWQLVSNPLTNGGQSWKLNPTWDWQRDHWTVTVWQLGTASGGNGIDFGAQNWNTVFGDAWHYQVVIPCSATKPVPPSS
ncbi:MAG: hypothetical protein U0Q07_18250 [Acidimicrobiales bacterium]